MPENAFGQEVGDPVPDWSPRPRPPRRPIEGRFCRIEPLAPTHAKDLFEAFAAAPDGRDWTYMATERFDDPEAWAAWIAAESVSDDPLHHAMIDRESGTATGKAAYLRIDPTNGVIEIGSILLAQSLQGTTAATEAIFLLMQRAFDELGYRRVEWKCDALNAASRRAALRFGFCFEGIFRQAVVTKGRNRDTAWYAMLDSEWPAAREAFNTWLTPDNFGADGRQKRGLASLR